MEREEKELLLKDLCARLPYGVKLKCASYKIICIGLYKLDTIVLDRILNENTEYVPFDEFKPYLFPLSSMTEEQKKELRQMDAFINSFGNICFATYDEYGHDIIPTYEDAIRITNWLNKNHFDFRGLIPKNLAEDATGKNIY